MKIVILYPVTALIMIAVLLTGLPQPVLSDAFIKLGDIPGECNDKDHVGWSDVVKWEGTFRPVSIKRSSAGSGQITSGKIIVVKPADSSSDTLKKMCSESVHIPEVRFEILKPGSDPAQYMVYILKDVVITSMWQEYSGDLDSQIVDSLSLNFSYGKYQLKTIP